MRGRRAPRTGAGAAKGHSSAAPRRHCSASAMRAVVLQKIDVFQVLASRRFSCSPGRRSIASRQNGRRRHGRRIRRRGVRRAVPQPSSSRSRIEPDGHRASRLFPQGRRLPVGMSGPHPGSRIHPADRRRPLRRRLPRQLEIERVPGHSRAHLRSPVRACVPSRPRRGGLARASQGEAKPEPVAICRLKRVAADYKEDIRAAPAEAAATRATASAIALVGAGPGVADRRARSRAARLRVRRVRRRSAGGRHDAHADPEVPAARSRHRRGGRLRPRRRHRVSRRRAHRFAREAARPDAAERWDAVFIGSGAPRGRDLDIPGRREAAANIHIGIDWLSSVSFGHTTRDRQARRRAGRRQHRDGLLPQLAAPRRRRRAASSCAPASTR